MASSDRRRPNRPSVYDHLRATTDENRSVLARLLSQLDGVWWSLRVLGRTVVDRPVPSSFALVLVVVGLFGDSFVPIPDYSDAILFLIGALSLVSLSRTRSGR